MSELDTLLTSQIQGKERLVHFERIGNDVGGLIRKQVVAQVQSQKRRVELECLDDRPRRLVGQLVVFKFANRVGKR